MKKVTLNFEDSLIAALRLIPESGTNIVSELLQIADFMSKLDIVAQVQVEEQRYDLSSIMQLMLLVYECLNLREDSRLCLLVDKASEHPGQVALVRGYFEKLYAEFEQRRAYQARKHAEFEAAVQRYMEETGGSALSITLMGSKISQKKSFLRSEIGSNIPVRYQCYEDDEIRLSSFPKIAKSDIVVFNWNKFAFLFRLFLNDEPAFRTCMVLYTGICRSYGYSVSHIKSFGIFDYVISSDKESGLLGGDEWDNVLDAVIHRRGNRVGQLQPVDYLLYRWSSVTFGASHFQICVVGTDALGNQKRWGTVPESYEKAAGAFKSLWTYEVRGEGGTMDVNPIWGKPEYSGKKNYCFVLMPFQEPFETIYNDHVKMVLESNNITVDRASDYYTTNSVMKDIWSGINNADIVIAELTGRNPNVLYELGIAHTLGKDVIMISQNEEDIPFDLKHLRHYVYEYTPRGCTALMDDIEKAVRNILSS